MIKASLRGLLHRKLRLTLAIVAIVLSVGFLSAITVLNDTLNKRFSGLFQTLNENVAVQVQAKEVSTGETPRLTAAQLQQLSNVDGVNGTSGDVSDEAVVPFKKDGNEVTAQGFVGVGASGDDPLGLISLREGTWPKTASEVALSANTAKLAGVKRGETIKVFVSQVGEPKPYTVSGIVEFSGGRDSLAGESLVIFELGHAQEMFYGQKDVFAGASFSADSGVSQDELKKRITAALPSGFEAKTGDEVTEEQSNQLAGQFDFIKIILNTFAYVAAFVGIFLIYNTFNIVVAQRSRELALLRAMGASWGQVTGAVILEALIVGVVGSTLGLAAGIGAGMWGESALTGALGAEIKSAGVVVSPAAIITAYVIGILVTLIAAFVPAIKASLVPPLAAMREIARPDKSLKGLSITGAALAVPGIGIALLGLYASFTGSIFVMGFGLVLALIGLMLLSPLLARPVVRVVGMAVAWGQAGKLGVRNSLRNPRRTAVTAIALMIGVTLIGAAATVVSSFKHSLQADIGKYDVAIMIVGPNYAPPNGKTGFEASALDKVEALPGVTGAEPWWLTIESSIAGQPIPVVATDVAAAQKMWKLETVGGALRTLSAGEFVSDHNTAKSLNWKVGDSVKVRVGTTERDYKLVGIYKATPSVSGPVFGLPAVDDFEGKLAYQGFVTVEPGTDVAATVAATEKIMADYPGVTVGDMSTFLKQFNQIFDFLLLAVTILLGMALLIAVLGILNTLLLSIVERTREMGLVRAIGLSRGGVVRMIGVESILISVFGALLGLAAGVGIGVLLCQALIEGDFLTEIVLPWGNLAAYVGAAMFFGIVAAIIPAWRAAKLDVLEAIAYE